MTHLWLSGVFFHALNTPKLVFAPRPSSRLGRGHLIHLPFSFEFRRLRHFDLGAEGASVVRPPTQIPGYAYVYTVPN